MEGAQKIVLGRSIEGKDVSFTLAEMKSTLIGGVSGSGKSTLLKSIVDQAKDIAQVVIIDAKRVSFMEFKDTCKVVTDVNEVPKLLQAVSDMVEGRYIEMEQNSTDICTRPHILLVIDEMANVLPYLNKNCKNQLHQILSLGRQANITVIGATQSPSKAVIGSLIVDQFQTRIGLRVSNRAASQVVIGEGGCERIANYSAIMITPHGYKVEMKLISPNQKPQNERLDYLEFA